MSRKSSLLMVLAMTAACGAFAQVYKSIGPDGKTVYSDKPPADADTKSTVIGAPAQPPQAGPPEAPAAQEPKEPKSMAEKKAEARARRARAKSAVSPSPPQDLAGPPPAAPAPAAAAATLDPAVEKALIGVMGMEDLVLQTEELCRRTLPTSFKRYSTAASWQQRNAAVLAQQRRVLSEAVSASQRRLIEGALKVKNQRMLALVADAPMASKIKWCDESSEEINSGRMDVQNNEKLAPPLMNYRPKAS